MLTVLFRGKSSAAARRMGAMVRNISWCVSRDFIGLLHLVLTFSSLLAINGLFHDTTKLASERATFEEAADVVRGIASRNLSISVSLTGIILLQVSISEFSTLTTLIPILYL